jgi:hypothetical protein
MPRRAATTCSRTMLLFMGSPVALGAMNCGPSAEEKQRAKAQAEFRSAFERLDPNGEPDQRVQHPHNVLVARGRSPVVFQTRTAATVRVTDLTNGAQIAVAAADPDQWISVNEDSGVLVGRRRIVPGPLPAGHEFGIVLDVSEDESFTTRVTRDPMPPPRMKPYQPATQPVSQPPAQPGNQ